MRGRILIVVLFVTVVFCAITVYYPYYVYNDYDSTRVLITDSYKGPDGNWHASGMDLATSDVNVLTNVKAKHNIGDIIHVAMVGDCLCPYDDEPWMRTVCIVLLLSCLMYFVYIVYGNAERSD